jgi:hypothetical protein
LTNNGHRRLAAKACIVPKTTRMVAKSGQPLHRHFPSYERGVRCEPSMSREFYPLC